MITIVLADDHPIVRRGLVALLDAEHDCTVIGEAAESFTATRLVEQLQPTVLVVDLMMPGLGGLEVVRRVRMLPSPPSIVVLSMHADEQYVLEALRSGAAAYVLKENDPAEVITAVRTVAAGQHYLSSPLSERAIDAYIHQTQSAPIDPFQLLTPREREILWLVAKGYTSTLIAAQLQISPRTVETHRANLMRKLELHTQAELAHFVTERGMTDVPTQSPRLPGSD
ncbi:MAG: response regulator [Oscillochloridaceae bacterium umkhey_bin13]